MRIMGWELNRACLLRELFEGSFCEEVPCCSEMNSATIMNRFFFPQDEVCVCKTEGSPGHSLGSRRNPLSREISNAKGNGRLNQATAVICEPGISTSQKTPVARVNKLMETLETGL